MSVSKSIIPVTIFCIIACITAAAPPGDTGIVAGIPQEQEWVAGEGVWSVPFFIEPALISRAHGYLLGQAFSLQRIRREFLQLEAETMRSDLEFRAAFGTAEQRIDRALRDYLGEEFEMYKDRTTKSLKEVLGKTQWTAEQAAGFLEEVRLRAAGVIESPVLEVLLAFRFVDRPAGEIADGFFETFSTKDHIKSRGLNITFRTPRSWNSEEGDRPHIVRKFTSQEGRGPASALIMVREMGLPGNRDITQAESDALFSAEGLKLLVPEGSSILSSKRVVLDRQPGAQLIVRTTVRRLDMTLTLQLVYYVTCFRGKLILLQCGVAGEDGPDLQQRFEHYYPLFRLMANSLVLMDQYFN